MTDELTPGYVTRIILDDKRIVGYRPSLIPYAGSLTATVLLCQILHWATHKSNPFYKFIQPCNHPNYKFGDSWCEELGMSRFEFAGAIKKIGIRIDRKDKYPDPGVMVWYWSVNNVTWFKANWERIEIIFSEAYSVNTKKCLTDFAKSETAKPISQIAKSDFAKSETAKPISQIATSDFAKSETANNNKQILQQIVSSSSSELDMNTCVHVKTDFDDDDLFKDLTDLGVSTAVAVQVLKTEPRELIVAKLNEIMQLFARGRINNLIGYSSKAFSQKLYSSKQAERILGGTTQAVRKSIEEEPFGFDVDISAIDNSIVEEYIQTLKPVMLKTYNERGFDSLMLRAGLSMYDKAKRESING